MPFRELVEPGDPMALCHHDPIAIGRGGGDKHWGFVFVALGLVGHGCRMVNQWGRGRRLHCSLMPACSGRGEEGQGHHQDQALLHTNKIVDKARGARSGSCFFSPGVPFPLLVAVWDALSFAPRPCTYLQIEPADRPAKDPCIPSSRRAKPRLRSSGSTVLGCSHPFGPRRARLARTGQRWPCARRARLKLEICFRFGRAVHRLREI